MARRRNRRRVDPSAGGAVPRGRPALRRGAAFAAALLLGGAAAAAGWRSLAGRRLLPIAAVRFEGLSRASPAELAALSPVKPGDDLLGADLRALEQALLRNPWVRSAAARRRLPPEIVVRVDEREPRALVDLGGLYLVDREAKVFKRAAAGDGLDLPLVTGFTRDDYAQRRADVEPLLAGALALLDGWEREGLGPLGAVSEIHVDADEGVTVYAGREGAQVRLGVGELPAKLGRLHHVLAALRERGAAAGVIHLDNRNHPSWVTVRLAGGAGQGVRE